MPVCVCVCVCVRLTIALPTRVRYVPTLTKQAKNKYIRKRYRVDRGRALRVCVCACNVQRALLMDRAGRRGEDRKGLIQIRFIDVTVYVPSRCSCFGGDDDDDVFFCVILIL